MAIDQDALQNIDWVQVVLNGGPPCFHLEEGRFCLRAEKWSGHHIHNVHKFVSLAAYAAECVRAERERCKKAICMWCAKGNVPRGDTHYLAANCSIVCEAAAIEREG